MAITLGVGPVQSTVGISSVTLNGVTAGRSLIVGIQWLSASATVSSVTCSGESNLSLLTPQAASSNWGSGTANILFALLDKVTASGNKTVTVNFSGSVQYRQLFVMEIDGADTAGLLDTESNGTGNSTNPTRTITTGDDNAMVVAFIASQSADPTTGAGYTGFSMGNIYPGSHVQYDLDVGAAGSVSVPFVSGTSQNWVMASVSILPAPPPPLDFSFIGSGGVSVGGSADIVHVPYNHVASGGVSVGGSAGIVMVPFQATGSGGVSIGGSATVRSVVKKAVEITYALRLQVGVQLPYLLRYPVSKDFVLPWTTRVSAAFDISNDFRVAVQAGAEINYDLHTRSLVAAAVELRHSLRLQSSVDVAYSLRPTVRSGAEVCWNLRNSVKVGTELRYALKPRNQVTSAITAIWSLTQPYVQSVTDQPHLIHNGRKVAILDGDISASEGGFAWEGNFTLASVEDYVQFKQNDLFEANLYGESWSFIVDGKELSRREPAGVDTRIIGISPSAQYTNPRAPRKDYEWDSSVMAQAAAKEVTSPSTVWGILDWNIPAYRLAFSEAEPLDVVRRLAEVAGGIVESTLAGVLRVRPLYPVSPQDYPTATPDHVFLELQDIIEASETYGYSRVENRFRLMDVQQTNQDRLEWVPDANGAFVGYMRAYPSPWRTNVILSHTADQLTLSIGAQEESMREEEELVEIYKGQGNTQYPIYDIVSLQWEATNLGGIVHAVDSTDVFAVGPQYNSLVRIKYRTRFLRYRVVSSSGHPAQFLLESALE